MNSKALLFFMLFVSCSVVIAMETPEDIDEPLIIEADPDYDVSDDARIIFNYPKNILKQWFPNNELGYALAFINKHGNHSTIYAQYLRAANTHEAQKVTAEPYQKTIISIQKYTPLQASQLYQAFESMYKESDEYKQKLMQSTEGETESY